MMKCLKVVFAIVILVSSAGYGETFNIEPEFVPDEVLVKFKPGLEAQSIKAVISGHGAISIKRIPRIDVHVLKVQTEKHNLMGKIREFQRDPRVAYAEPNYILHACVEAPNDPSFSSQWGLTYIDALSAWDRTTGSSSIVVAIVDTGVDLNHPDLKNKMIAGYDFVNGDNIAQDDDGHGTHCAGIVAAETNNGVGVAGVSWGSKIMPVKVLGPSGGSSSDCAAGIIYATDNGADVISMSFGGWEPSGYDTTLHDAVKYAYATGAVLVAAAGNDGWPMSFQYGGYLWQHTPSAYPECIAVAATDTSDRDTWWSNYGSELDVSAPGDNIYSTYWAGGSTYAYFSGTSMAAPFVSGLAALILADKPWLSNEEVMYKVRYSAEDANSGTFPGVDDYMGYGRINASVAIIPIEVGR